MVGRAAGDGLADHLTGHAVHLVLQAGLIGGNAHGLFVGQLTVQAGQQQLLGVLGGQTGDGFQLLGLLGLQLFGLGQAGFHLLGPGLYFFLPAFQLGGFLVQSFFLLVHAALLAGDVRPAFLDLLVGLGLQAKRLVLGFHNGFLAFLFSGFDGFVYNAHGLFFGAADLGLSGLAAIGGPSNKTGAHQRSTDNDCHHHLYDGQCQVDSLLELQFLQNIFTKR